MKEIYLKLLLLDMQVHGEEERGGHAIEGRGECPDSEVATWNR